MQRFCLVRSLAAFVAVLTGAAAAASVDQRMLTNEADGGTWPAYGRTASENHYSPLAAIDTGNVGRLSLAWYHDLDVMPRTDSQPLAADGRVYLATGLSIVRALDARSGALLWRYDPRVGRVAGAKLRGSWGIRGLALWGDRVFLGTTDGRLLALESATGRLVWSVETLDPNDETSITGAPRIFKGKILIGYGGGDRNGGSRGALNCYDAASGRHLWRFYTVPGDPSRGFENAAMRGAAKTWPDRWWKESGGGAVWNAITYDDELNRIYIGTGNANPWNPSVRNRGAKAATNLFTASIVAIDADTGRYIWHYQENPDDAWDYDSATDLITATLPLAGQPRKVLLHAPKNGFFYVLDRETGHLISAEKLGRVTWAEGIDLESGLPIEAPGIRYEQAPIVIWPGIAGRHNWPPMSFSPRDRLVFIPAIHSASLYNMEGVLPDRWDPARHTWTTGLGDPEQNLPADESGSALVAWDPIAGREVWRTPTAGTWGAGTMATAGGLVFQGSLDGTFNAYDSLTGKKLWSFAAGVAVLGAPIAFSVAGKQYITVLSGPPTASAAFSPGSASFGWTYRENPRRVLTFALDAAGTLPAARAPVAPGPLRAGPAADPALARAGIALYGIHCTSCHGRGGISGGSAPDLQASAILLSPEAFAHVVHDGALVDRGMPRYEEFSGADLEAIRNFVRASAERSATVTPPGRDGSSR